MTVCVEEHWIQEAAPIVGEGGRLLALADGSHDGTLDTDSMVHSPSLGERIQSGKSILTLSGLITTKEETQYLVKLSQAAATSQKRTNSKNCTLDQGMQVCVVRMPIMAAAEREICLGMDTDGLPETLSLFLEEVLERALVFIDDQLCPSLKETLFGDSKNPDPDLSIVQLFRQNQLEYSRREPAVNVYTAPNGQFGMHTDNKALTILIPLSDPSIDFTGGGTAFWSESCPIEGEHDPSLVLIPKAGTAMLFGGTVNHKGLPIDTGTRVVFVASFSPLQSNFRIG
jgi:hypothetical protein